MLSNHPNVLGGNSGGGGGSSSFNGLPSADNTTPLGSSALRWSNGFFGGTIRIGNGTSGPTLSASTDTSAADLVFTPSTTGRFQFSGNVYITGTNSIRFGNTSAGPTISAPTGTSPNEVLTLAGSGNGLIAFTNNAQTAGIAFSLGTDGQLRIRTKDNSADASFVCAALTATTGAFSGAVSLGNTVNAVSPTSPNRTVTIVIGGTTYYLAAKTTND